MTEFAAIAGTYGLPAAVAAVLAILLYKDRERERAQADKRDDKNEARIERLFANNERMTEALEISNDTMKRLTDEVEKQRPLQNDQQRALQDLKNAIREARNGIFDVLENQQVLASGVSPDAPRQLRRGRGRTAEDDL